MHRVRDRLVSCRTAVSNQIGGLLIEHGITMRKGRGGLHGVVQELLEEENTVLSPAMRTLISGLWVEWQATDAAVRDFARELERLARQDPAGQRLMTVPGVGPLVATAMIATVADG